MGQYYYAVILNDNKTTIKHWMYSHDYASGLKLMEHSWIKNPFVLTFETLLDNTPQRVVWAGDYADQCKRRKTNVHDRCWDSTKVRPRVKENFYRYVVNHSKGLFIDKKEIPEVDGWKIHPLPLMTCEGNGRGGGDYRTEHNDLIGSWARDVISVSNTKPKNMSKIIFNLTEQ